MALHNSIEYIARAADLSASEYLRRMVVKGKVVVRQEVVAKVSMLKKLIAEFGKIGSNINQIAHHYNVGGVRSREMYERTQRAISELYAMKYEVEKTGGEFRGYSEAYRRKNSNYGQMHRYLLFQHDSRAQKPILDENGDMMLWEGYLMDGHRACHRKQQEHDAHGLCHRHDLVVSGMMFTRQ